MKQHDDCLKCVLLLCLMAINNEPLWLNVWNFERGWIINIPTDFAWNFFYIMVYRPIAKQGLCKQWLFLGNGSVNTFLRDEYARNNRATVGNGMFLCGLWRDVISKGQSQLLGSSVRDTVKKRVSCQRAQLKVQLWRYVWYLECVIEWDCYSSCVKIHCEEMANRDCNRLRTLVCVCPWSAKCRHKSWVYKWSINRVTNPNPIYSHLYMWQYVKNYKYGNVQELVLLANGIIKIHVIKI
jgi:hypothetical protein